MVSVQVARVKGFFDRFKHKQIFLEALILFIITLKENNAAATLGGNSEKKSN
jgi:hypothetical protein